MNAIPGRALAGSGQPMRAARHLALLLLALPACTQEAPPTARAETPVPIPFLDDPTFFPLGVWVQAPGNGKRYRDLGINLYVGLWQGPTREQLAELDRQGLRVICAQNAVALAHEGPTVLAWMHDDEPDNAQAVAGGGYGPPIEPARVIEDYQRMRKADPTRPVLLNLGQGVGWDGWWGRGVRTNHPEDYPEYLKACDLVSFDIYPVTHGKAEVQGRLELVGHGVQRLRRWSDDRKPVFACIETTHIDNPDRRPSPAQVRSEVWIAIASGARGIVYFAHEFKPKFVEDGLLSHPEIAAAVREVNAEITALAPVLHGPTLDSAVAVRTTGGAGLAVLCKRDGEDLVVFTASLTGTPTTATFQVAGGKRDHEVRVLGESRTVAQQDGRFADEFAGYAVHHYRVRR